MTRALLLIMSAFLYSLAFGFPGAPGQEAVSISVDPQAFKDYWYQGKAEISRYQLKQARYGEIHEGDAVLIFVTEDFLAKEQVKHEFGDGTRYPILKLNATRNFRTGLYPYSLMSSSFTQVDFGDPKTQKITFTGQEWCGHVFMQLNRDRKNFKVQHFSYFQAEGDAEKYLPFTHLEDDLWTRIRIAPNTLPTGKIQILPSLLITRLSHKPFEPLTAEASLNKTRESEISDKDVIRYALNYTGADRLLEIYFEPDAPYRILGWRDSHQSGFGPNAKKLQTVAIRTHELVTDYWAKNKNEDRALRSQLGLE